MPSYAFVCPRPFFGARASTACLMLAAAAVCSAADSNSSAVFTAPTADRVAASAGWSGSVTLARLVAAAEASHPTAAAIAATQAAAAAQVRQAGVWANPELEVSVGRTRPHSADLERDQPYGGSLRQRLTWWGTRNARVAAAQAQQSAVGAAAETSRLELQAEVHRAAILYAAAGEALVQATEEARIAAELATLVAARRTAGEADQSTAARARLEATTAALRHDARRREVATALAVLRTWCDPALPAELVVADAFSFFTISRANFDAASLATAAKRHPQLRALAEAAAAANATVSAERQARIPDLTVGAFAEREAEKDTYGATLGFALPLWDRNDSAIAAAEATRAQARATGRAERLRLQRDLIEALGAFQSAQGEAAALGEQAMPVADEAIRLRDLAYQSGEASLADLLESRRAATAVRVDLQLARRRAALALVDLGLAVGDLTLGQPSQP